MKGDFKCWIGSPRDGHYSLRHFGELIEVDCEVSLSTQRGVENLFAAFTDCSSGPEVGQVLRLMLDFDRVSH
jgi:hypothetical protein